ncbi:unnamed protein product [Cuscuta campestris]|uniref:V-type proton ATPase subunit a n=1 Tax=Cuscuta campestris TaxID=132261 RepID=A0A484NPW7_9ASTE|nr:unnamed protein product [Cuscuta campestris]
MNTNSVKLERSYNELLEYKLVMQKASEFFHSAQSSASDQHIEFKEYNLVEGLIDSPLLLEQTMSVDPAKQVKLGYVSGLVAREKSMAFERILFRATMGNVFVKQVAVDDAVTDPVSGEKVQAALDRAALDCNSQVGTVFQGDNQTNYVPEGTVSHLSDTNRIYLKLKKLAVKCASSEALVTGPAVETLAFMAGNLLNEDVEHGTFLEHKEVFEDLNEKNDESSFDSTTYPSFIAQKLGDIMDMTFGARYVILMMALFSIYTGFIYNEFFSVPFEIFGRSAYACNDPSCRDATTTGLIKAHETYPFGVDPKWHGSRSELPFLNSLKMKMSILLGVGQMNLGMILSYFNAKFFRNDVDIWHQFIPQIIFLNSLFGYLSLLIIVKWCTGSQADLYHVMIYMFLSPTDDLGENQLFAGQKYLQISLLLLALVAVPWMLFPKPFILKKQYQERHGHGSQSYDLLHNTDDAFELETDDHKHGDEDFEFSEVFIHQLIHTIEFVLGAVSNTASYLRLWALSLAHSESSSVFYEKVLLLSMGFDNVILLISGIIVFVGATVGVLLVMETLSAFLHALRLHWLEFQNKFYQGGGYKFSPFSFPTIGEDDD